MIQILRMRDTPPKADGSTVTQNSLIPLGTFPVVLVKQVLSYSSAPWLPCAAEPRDIQRHFPLLIPCWLWQYEWPSLFTSKGYSLIPLVKYCMHSTLAPSLISELEQGPCDWARARSWVVYSDGSSMQKAELVLLKLSASPRTESIAWRPHGGRSLAVLGVPAAWNKLCTHTQRCSDLCISMGVSGTACLWRWSRKESYLEQDQSRDKQSLPRYSILRVH